MKLGFIGCGNMACAMIGGIIKNNILNNNDIIASAKTEATLEKVKDEFGINVCKSNIEVVKNSEIIVIAVKPQYYQEVINEIKYHINKSNIIISIAPGISIKRLSDLFENEVKIIRTMPNTPALVCSGVTAVCASENVNKDELESVCKILKGFGICEIVPESMMEVVVSVSGSSPAYVFMFIEAMADAAVADGMPRDKAYKFAAAAVLGSAKMVLETGKHPAELKDMVCSPGGTTIEAVRTLERCGFRTAVIEAMKSCTTKVREM